MFCKGIKLSRILAVKRFVGLRRLCIALPSKTAQPPLKCSPLFVRLTLSGIERSPARSRRRLRCV